jgi:predicted polyphosphate/ATP-dependent NAD kinase
MKKIGLIINPLAGIGGRVGLKGSDGPDIQQRALEMGAEPEAGARTQQALQVLSGKEGDLVILAAPGEMGAEAARRAGQAAEVVGEITRGRTTAADTIHAASLMVEKQVDLLVFSGGDGTARDIYQAVGERFPVVGIPAGVKIHSPVFATQPKSAGELIAAYIKDAGIRLQQAEVIDLDEEAYRQGTIATRLYGYLTIPFHRRWVQNSKAPSPDSEKVQMEAIAWQVVENMQAGKFYVLGPGTTTRAVADQLGFEKTLVGVDVVTREAVVARDVNEAQLLELISPGQACIVVTPVGGQGFLFGRGNQPISPHVISAVDPKNIQVICTPGKLHSFSGRPLLVDTGDPELDAQLSGHITIITGYQEEAVYRIGR